MTPDDLRRAVLASLPEETSTFGQASPYQHFHLPPGHLKVLGPEANIVSGSRGAGKTFWAGMLTNDHAIEQLVTVEPSLAGFRGLTGFAERSAIDTYPDERTFQSLMREGFDAEDIWRGVVLRILGEWHKQPVPRASWRDTTHWVASSPELVARALEESNSLLDLGSEVRLIVFDALDRSARDWATMDRILAGLLRVVLALKPFPRIRTKVFLRDDQLTRAVLAFPDASKLTATMVELVWQPHDLHALLWQYLINGPGEHGERLRQLYVTATRKAPRILFERYQVGTEARREGESQRALFEALAGKYMGRDHRRGVPYVWIVSHLDDTKRRASPRSFLAAIRAAADDSMERYPHHGLALHYESIKRGVQSASRIRVEELAEDFPWVRVALDALKGLSVPCHFEMFRQRWREAFPDGLPADERPGGPMLPPPHGASWQGVADDLVRIGVFERMQDGRINMPDLYRVGFGLGRRGGVRPV